MKKYMLFLIGCMVLFVGTVSAETEPSDIYANQKSYFDYHIYNSTTNNISTLTNAEKLRAALVYYYKDTTMTVANISKLTTADVTTAVKKVLNTTISFTEDMQVMFDYKYTINYKQSTQTFVYQNYYGSVGGHSETSFAVMTGSKVDGNKLYIYDRYYKFYSTMAGPNGTTTIYDSYDNKESKCNKVPCGFNDEDQNKYQKYTHVYQKDTNGDYVWIESYITDETDRFRLSEPSIIKKDISKLKDEEKKEEIIDTFKNKSSITPYYSLMIGNKNLKLSDLSFEDAATLFFSSINFDLKYLNTCADYAGTPYSSSCTDTDLLDHPILYNVDSLLKEVALKYNFKSIPNSFKFLYGLTENSRYNMYEVTCTLSSSKYICYLSDDVTDETGELNYKITKTETEGNYYNVYMYAYYLNKSSKKCSLVSDRYTYSACAPDTVSYDDVVNDIEKYGTYYKLSYLMSDNDYVLSSVELTTNTTPEDETPVDEDETPKEDTTKDDTNEGGSTSGSESNNIIENPETGAFVSIIGIILLYEGIYIIKKKKIKSKLFKI